LICRRRVGGGLHALGVDDAGGEFGLVSGSGTRKAGQVDVELGEDAVVLPGGEVAVDGLMRCDVVRQVAPEGCRCG
jgi:hypothetical protein